MRDAGFSDFHWVDAMLDPTEQDDPFWDDFMAQAPLTAFCDDEGIAERTSRRERPVSTQWPARGRERRIPGSSRHASPTRIRRYALSR